MSPNCHIATEASLSFSNQQTAGIRQTGSQKLTLPMKYSFVKQKLTEM